MNQPSFQTRYCERCGVPAEKFRAHLLAATLYPHARLLRPLLVAMDGQYFQADHEFIGDMTFLVSREAFHEALEGYVNHYSNRRFLRHRLRLRISVRRMWRMVHETLPEEHVAGRAGRSEYGGSLTPFTAEPDEERSAENRPAT